MGKNSNLHKAKREKNDEFYTQLSDIENELKHYESHFEGKIVYSNCDSPDSNFVKYFTENKERLGIKEFYHTWYNQETGEGSFDSAESIEVLKKADIVVSNPPFSLFRKYVSLLELHNKKYLVIGSMNAITYKETFKLIKDNKLWLGITAPKEFIEPDKSIKKFGNICWFTNLSHKKRNEKMILYKEYSPEEYLKYDNYAAINVDKVKDIPLNYDGVMGVPITFLDRFNPDQFELVGCSANGAVEDWVKKGNYKTYNNPIIKMDKIYQRIFIKHKNQNNENTTETN